jgi:cation-transporting ATPase 13A3/4/5
MFGNIANFFGRSAGGEQLENRRFSTSERSSISQGSRCSRRSAGASERVLDTDEDEGERWGYSSAEEEDSEDEPLDVMRDNASTTASMAYDSEPSTPTQPTQNLPLLTMDSVLGGEARIDMDVSFTLLDVPPPGPPSRQTLYIADEDTTIRFIGYEVILWRRWLWKLGCFFSLGILALLGHWFPRLWLRWVAHEKAFIDSHGGFIVVEVRYSVFVEVSFLIWRKSSYRAITLLPIRVLDYQYHISTVFAVNVPIDQCTELYGSSLEQKMNEHLDSENGVLKKLLVVDYRYTRYALDPRSGLFIMIK